MIRTNKFLVNSSTLISITAILLAMMVGLTTAANEIGFDETFALADDRSKTLNQLIPGTEDYYYYHCLHYQHTRDFNEVKKLLEQWIKRYNYSQKVQEIRNRQALLEYSHKPEETLKHIKKVMSLQFNHQKQELDKETHHPLSLDQQLISWDSLKNKAFRQHKKNLYGFEDSALEYLANQKLAPDRLRDLLQRLKRPDFPNLPELVVADLKHQYSRGFGSHRIHRQLLLSQLNRCLKLMPKLLDNSSFIQVYLTKLKPGADANPKIGAKRGQTYAVEFSDFPFSILDSTSLKTFLNSLFCATTSCMRSRALVSPLIETEKEFAISVKLRSWEQYLHAQYIKTCRANRFGDFLLIISSTSTPKSVATILLTSANENDRRR